MDPVLESFKVGVLSILAILIRILANTIKRLFVTEYFLDLTSIVLCPYLLHMPARCQLVEFCQHQICGNSMVVMLQDHNHFCDRILVWCLANSYNSLYISVPVSSIDLDLEKGSHFENRDL